MLKSSTVSLTHSFTFVDGPGLEYSQHCCAEKNQPVYCIPELWSHEKCLKKTVKIACHCLVDKTNKPYNGKQIKKSDTLDTCISCFYLFRRCTEGGATLNAFQSNKCKVELQNYTNLFQTLLMYSCHLRNMTSMRGLNYSGTSCWHCQQVYPLCFPESQQREIHVIKVELRLISQSH